MRMLDQNRQTGPELDLQQPQRPLSSIVLPGGLADRVWELLEEWTQTDKLVRYGLQPRNRVLLYGPPGNGKTTLAQAIASELELPMALVPFSEIVSSWQGETVRHVASIFRRATQQPCVLFFDEADSLCASRTAVRDSCDREYNSVVNTVLLELDRLPVESVVIFATNFDQVLDPAMRRRINLTLELPAPAVADLRRLIESLQERHPLWPLGDFDVAASGATSFAQAEQLATDHARRRVLQPDFDPLRLQGKPKSTWLREQMAASQASDDAAQSGGRSTRPRELEPVG